MCLLADLQPKLPATYLGCIAKNGDTAVALFLLDQISYLDATIILELKQLASAISSSGKHRTIAQEINRAIVRLLPNDQAASLPSHVLRTNSANNSPLKAAFTRQDKQKLTVRRLEGGVHKASRQDDGTILSV